MRDGRRRNCYPYLLIFMMISFERIRHVQLDTLAIYVVHTGVAKLSPPEAVKGRWRERIL